MKKLFTIILILSSVAVFGQRQVINVGTSANSGNGDKLRPAFQKCNSNSLELYNSRDSVAQVLADTVSLSEAIPNMDGIKLPVLTTTERNAISTPATGLFLFNSSTGKLNYYDGTAWREINHD